MFITIGCTFALSATIWKIKQTAVSDIPGMVATVDIRTGKKSVLDYLLKPFNKAQEALRER